MAGKESKFFKFLQENPREEKMFLCYLWLVIISSIIKIILLFPATFNQQQAEPQPKEVLAVVLVDAMIVNNNQERYLTGYRVECHETDISNIAKTPDINANLRSKAYLKFVYTISNHTNSEMLYYIDIIKDYEEKNLILSYSLNDAEEKQFENNYISGQIVKKSTFVITLYVRIDDNSFDADLSGKFSLNITYFADEESNKSDSSLRSE